MITDKPNKKPSSKRIEKSFQQRFHTAIVLFGVRMMDMLAHFMRLISIHTP